MFCENQDNPEFEMPCYLKGIYEGFSFISLLCSIFVIYATVKKIKMNLTNILIIQIIISEMLDEINILLGIIADSSGKLHFENYEQRSYVCYTQIFLSVFSCLWTLTASLFISLKLYDLIVNKSRIFRGKKFLNRNATFISVCVPLFISYLFYATHFILERNKNKINDIYENKIEKNKQRIKLVFCWINQETTIALSCIVALLIIANIYFSLIKGYCYLRKIKSNLLQEEEEIEINKPANKQIKFLDEIQWILFLYPVISCVIWIAFFLFMFLYGLRYFEKRHDGVSVFFCIFMSIRQIIYTFLYFWSQKKLREFSILFFCCKTCKKEKIRGNINPINISEVSPINNASEKNDSEKNDSEKNDNETNDNDNEKSDNNDDDNSNDNNDKEN